MLGLPLPTEEDAARLARLAATLDQIALALERIATLLERINSANIVDPAKVEALQSQLDASSASLKTSLDAATNPT